MMNSRLTIGLLAFAFILSFSCPVYGALRVWAIGDGIRIDPESGIPIEQQQTFFGPVVESDYKEHNWVWNGVSRTVSLRAARNEVVSCQLVIETDDPVTHINLSASDLVGPDGNVLSASRLRMFREWYVFVKESLPTRGAVFRLKPGWYPDALIPLDAAVHGAPFEIPGKDFYAINADGTRGQELLTQTNQAVWVDLYVPDSTPRGIYTGTVSVTAEGEPDTVIRVELEVFDFKIPDEFHTTWEFMEYGRVAQGPEDLELRTFRLAQQHRVTLSSTKMMPELVGQGYKVRFDWTRFDDRWAKYLDGSAFLEGPGKGQPLRHILLPFDARVWRPDKKNRWKGQDWPFPLPGGKGQQKITPEYAEAFSEGLARYEDHFDQQGWTGTRMLFWPDGVDEPGVHHGEIGLASLKLAKQFGGLLRRSETDRIWYRLDIGGGLRSAIDVDGDGRIEPGINEVVNYMEDVVDVWNVHGNCIDPEVLNTGPGSQWKDVWFYNGFPLSVGSMVIVGESLGFRTWQWIARKYRLGGVCDWEFGRTAGANVFRQIGADPSVSIEYLRNMYIYPGDQIDLPGVPLPSIRLKMIRRANQDYEYFWLLTRKLDDGGAAVDRVVDGILKRGLRESRPAVGEVSVSPDYWSHKPAEWHNARVSLGRMIQNSKQQGSSE